MRGSCRQRTALPATTVRASDSQALAPDLRRCAPAFGVTFMNGWRAASRLEAAHRHDAVLVDDAGALAHHVGDEVGGAVAVPGDVGLHLRADRVADGGLVIPVAEAHVGSDAEARVRDPERAEPALRLGAAPRQVVRPDIVGVRELVDREQVAPLLPTDHGVTLADVA